jgi:hypothetical protein
MGGFMSESKKYTFPCIGLAKDGSHYMVAVQCGYEYFSLTPDLAHSLATDLLIWADRVKKLNSDGGSDE